jgi:hypothetical protein
VKSRLNHTYLPEPKLLVERSIARIAIQDKQEAGRGRTGTARRIRPSAPAPLLTWPRRSMEDTSGSRGRQAPICSNNPFRQPLPADAALEHANDGGIVRLHFRRHQRGAGEAVHFSAVLYSNDFPRRRTKSGKCGGIVRIDTSSTADRRRKPSHRGNEARLVDCGLVQNRGGRDSVKGIVIDLFPSSYSVLDRIWLGEHCLSVMSVAQRLPLGMRRQISPG